MDKLTTQGNFYPMPSYMFLQDTTSRVTLLSGQPLGVSSREAGMTPLSLPLLLLHVTTYTVTLHVGIMEVVLDRKLLKDDSRGLGHGVTDNKVTLSSFRLLVEHRNSPDRNVSSPSSYVTRFAKRGLIHAQCQVSLFTVLQQIQQ